MVTLATSCIFLWIQNTHLKENAFVNVRNSSAVSKSNIQASQTRIAILFERSNNLFKYISDALDVLARIVCRCTGLHKHKHTYLFVSMASPGIRNPTGIL